MEEARPNAWSQEQAGAEAIQHVIMRPYPNVVFLYPTFVCSLICGALCRTSVAPENLGAVFIIVLGLNLLTLSVEFSRIKTVALVLLIAALIFLGLFLNTKYALFATLQSLIARVTIVANSQFYFAVGVIFAILYLIVYINTRFDYWELTPNELLHHHGFLGDLERFPAPNLRVTKEIGDVVEFLILTCGRLVLYPASTDRAIVLNNIMRVNSVEKNLKALLGTISVRVR